MCVGQAALSGYSETSTHVTRRLISRSRGTDVRSHPSHLGRRPLTTAITAQARSATRSGGPAHTPRLHRHCSIPHRLWDLRGFRSRDPGHLGRSACGGLWQCRAQVEELSGWAPVLSQLRPQFWRRDGSLSHNSVLLIGLKVLRGDVTLSGVQQGPRSAGWPVGLTGCCTPGVAGSQGIAQTFCQPCGNSKD